jgi:hypothetical protein
LHVSTQLSPHFFDARILLVAALDFFAEITDLLSKDREPLIHAHVLDLILSHNQSPQKGTQHGKSHWQIFFALQHTDKPVHLLNNLGQRGRIQTEFAKRLSAIDLSDREY